MQVKLTWINKNEVYTQIDIYRQNTPFEYSADLTPHVTITETGVNEHIEEVSQNQSWYYRVVIRNGVDFAVGRLVHYTSKDTGPGPSEIRYSLNGYDFYGIVKPGEFMSSDEYTNILELTRNSISILDGESTYKYIEPIFYKIGKGDKIMYINADLGSSINTLEKFHLKGKVFGKYKGHPEIAPTEPFYFTKDNRKYSIRLPWLIGYPDLETYPEHNYTITNNVTILAPLFFSSNSYNQAILNETPSEFLDIIELISGYYTRGPSRLEPIPGIDQHPEFLFYQSMRSFAQTQSGTFATASTFTKSQFMTIHNLIYVGTINKLMLAVTDPINSLGLGYVPYPDTIDYRLSTPPTPSGMYHRLVYYFIIELEKD